MSPRSASATPDMDKTREQLLAEVRELRARNALLERCVGGAEPLDPDLRKNESMTSLLLEQKLYGVWVNAGGRIAYVNEVGAQILGASNPAEVIGRSVLDEVIHPDYRDRVRDRIETMGGGDSTTPLVEEKFIRVDGSTVDVDVWAISFIYKGEPAFLVAFKDINRRKRAEEALAEKEKFLRNIFECIQDGISVLDKDLNIIRVNPAMEKRYGGHITGKKCYQAYHGQSAPCEACPSIRAIKTGSTQTGIVQDLSGWSEIYAFPLVDDQGKVTGVIEHVRDINERKRIEEALKRTQFALDNFGESAIWVMKDGRIAYVNQAACESLGYSREELLSLHIWDIDPGYSAESILELWQVRMLDRYTKFESTHVARDGRAFPVEVTSCYTRYGDEEYLITFDRDITERKRAEQALRESEEKYRYLVENANSIIIRWDMRGNITFFNEFAEKLFGYSKNEVLGRNVVGTIVPRSESTGRDLEALMEEVKRRPRQYQLNVNENMCKNGDRVWIAWTNKAIRDERGNVVELLSVGNDITERKRAEEALVVAKAQAELYVDLMGHDINNMNQISMGFLELAHNIVEMNGELGEDNLVLLDKAMGALADSSQLIDNVRKLQREKMGLYKPEVIDVGAMVRDAVKQFHSIPGRNIKIICDAADHCLVRANSLLKDVFINLVGNAVKHSRGDLTVTVRVDKVTDDGIAYCRVAVEDDGPGIPDPLKETLFDRLNLTSTRAKGKGFGICLIKMLVDDYNGKFWVEDRVSGDHTKGARFIVMLPAIEN